MKRPLVYALGFLIAGVLTAYYLPAERLGVAGLLVFLAGSAVIGVVWLRARDRRVVCHALIFFVFYGLGIVAVMSRTGFDPQYAALVGSEVEIRGVVVDEARTGSGYRLIIRTESGVRMMVSTMNERPVGTGGTVALRAVLEDLSPRLNPGGFDERLYMRARGVQYKAFCRQVTPLAGGLGLRERVAAVYDSVLPAKEAGIIKAMILGDRTGLSDEIKTLYRVAGVYHILAISGLHISVLALALDALLSRLWSRRVAGLATIVFLVLYSVFTGSSVSVVRAAVMCGVMISGPILYRENDGLSAMAFAAIALLLWQPLYLWDVGFLYSFTAVFGILTISGPIKTAVSRGCKKLTEHTGLLDPVIETFAVTLAATLGTTPVAAYFFYTVMPYGLLANLLIVPSAGLVVVLGFLTGIVGLVAEPLAVFLSGGLYLLFKIYEGICGVFAALPGAVILTGSWSPVLVAGWYLLVAAVAFGAARVFMLGLAAYAALVFITTLPGPPELRRLNVEDGACAVFLSGGEAYVFDGGGRNAYALANDLAYCGVAIVDGYFVLHGSLNEADAMLAELCVRAVFVPPRLAALQYYATDDTIVQELTPGRVLQKGTRTFVITDGYGVTVRDGEKEFTIE